MDCIVLKAQTSSPVRPESVSIAVQYRRLCGDETAPATTCAMHVASTQK